MLAVMLAGLGGASLAYAEGTNQRERFFLRHQNCPWTDEMGQYIYQCVKDNDGFNAHWCHNDAIDKFCPVTDAAGNPSAAAKPDETGKEAASGKEKEQL